MERRPTSLPGSVLMAEKEEKGPVFAHLEDVREEQWEDRGLRYSLTIDHRFSIISEGP